jgi:hypothetical protein
MNRPITINGDNLVQKKHQHMRLGTQDVNNNTSTVLPSISKVIVTLI